MLRARVPMVLALLAITAAGCSGDAGVTTTGAPSTSTTSEPTTTSILPTRSYDFDRVSDLLGEAVTHLGLSGAGLIVVERDDGIVHEEYWGDFDADRTSLIASASKMLSAGVLLRLSDEGLLDLDAPVADVVDWGSGNPDVTPAQLLSNSSGLVGIFPDPVYLPYICQYLPEGTLGDCAASIMTTADDDADVIPPDTTFRYGGGQWQVAGAVAESAAGRSWAELVDETYVEPCGLAPGSLGYANSISQMGNGIDYPSEFDGDPSTLATTDNPNIEAGAFATPAVFADLMTMFLRGGECGSGARVLSSESIERMVDDRVAAYGGSAGSGLGYGLGWWIDRRSDLAYSVGAYGAMPALDLEAGYGFYLVLEANETAWLAIANPLGAAIEAAVLAARG